MSLPNSPHLLKGALIYFGAPMLIPVPNVIAFQYNPVSLTRVLKPWQPPAKPVEAVEAEYKDGQLSNETALNAYWDTLAQMSQPFDPKETFSLVLELNATDALEAPDLYPVAAAVGVADRLAAIETLLYPPGDSLLGGLMGTVRGSVSFAAGGVTIDNEADASAAGRQLKRRDAPIVLFFWGPGRIVPVRITDLTIVEDQYSAKLYPIHAKVTIGLRVLDLDDLVRVTGELARKGAAQLARACYKFTRAQKEALATANLINSAESIAGMIPS